MPEPSLRLKSCLSGQTSFLNRIKENFESVWRLSRAVFAAEGSVAAGAPIHLLDEARDKASFNAQAGSTSAHVLLLLALVLFLCPKPGKKTDLAPPGFTLIKALHFRPASPAATQSSFGKMGSSGDHNPLPPTAGNPVPYSSIVLSQPRPADLQNHALPVSPAVFDADAPDFTPPTKDPGLPLMQDQNRSGGPGEHGLGAGDKHGMGDMDGNGVGVADDPGPYAAVASPVVCFRCPDPAYSDEARKAKVQGSVTLRVLVGADGRVKSLQVTRGIGMGLDENAASAVRAWQFTPAKDAAHRAVATWITIETMFRLY